MPPRPERPQDLIDSLRRAGASNGAGHEATEGQQQDAGLPPRVFTLPTGLRGARLRVKPSAVWGAALVVVVVLIVFGVRVAWAERAAHGEPVPPVDVASATADLTADGRSGAGNAGATTASSGALSEASPNAPSQQGSAVHVIGAVREPGVVTVPGGARVRDVVEAAGGATDQAELNRVNLARVVADGERIWVPVIGADPPPDVAAPVGVTEPASTGEGSSAAPDLVDINTADEARLQDLPGVGPVTAAAMMEWRSQHGSFTTIEELLEVSGIGPRTLETLRPMVFVGP